MGVTQSDTVVEMVENIDESLTSVMPDSWVGFGRLVIFERDFSEKQHNFALELLERLNEKYPDTSGERLGEKAAEMTEKKLG